MSENNIHYLTVSVSRETGHDLTGSSASGRVMSGLQGCGLTSWLNWGRIHFQPHICVGRWTEGLRSLLVLGWRPVQFLCHMELSREKMERRRRASSLLHESQQGTESVWKTEVAVLYKVIPEASSNHLCLFYWLEASLRSCPNTRGSGQEDTNSRERESPRTILEPAHMAFLFLCKRDTVV